jgi:hypothetical protein
MTTFEVGQAIKVNGEKTEVLGRVKYSSPSPEYSIKMDAKRSWLEPDKGKWKLWKEASGEGNPVVAAVRNSDLADLAESTYGDFYVSSQGVATASESIGNTWGVKVGGKVELWRGKNMADKEWPLFIVERDKDGGIILWTGRYVSVE